MSIDLTRFERAVTARSTAALASCAFRCSASSSFARAWSVARSFASAAMRPVVLLHAIAIDAAERRGGAVGAADFAQVVDVEQQPPVAGAPQLVDLHQPRLDVGPLLVGLALQRRGPRPSPPRACAWTSAASRSISSSCSTLISRSTSSLRSSASRLRSWVASDSASCCSAASRSAARLACASACLASVRGAPCPPAPGRRGPSRSPQRSRAPECSA